MAQRHGAIESPIDAGPFQEPPRNARQRLPSHWRRDNGTPRQLVEIIDDEVKAFVYPHKRFVVEESATDLLVAGTHGRTGVARALRGSVR